MPERRNIIMVTFDSLRADHCGFMGYSRNTTPTLDKLAKRGVYFKNAVASGVPTPVSMMGIFTGKYTDVDSTCVNPFVWRDELKNRSTLAQKLSKIGYFTGAIHENAYVSSFFGFNKGFNSYIDNPTELRAKSSFVLKLKYRLHEFMTLGLRRLGFTSEISDVLLKMGTCSPWEVYYDLILDWIEMVKKPFFLWILLLDTHTPYIPPRYYLDDTNSFEAYYYWLILGNACRSGSRISCDKIKKIIKIYDNCIRYADLFVKRLVKDTSDCDPVYIFHADHGDGFGEHGIYQHTKPHYLYEELIHVPFLIYNVDTTPEKVIYPVSLVDMSGIIFDIINGRDTIFDSAIRKKDDTFYAISRTVTGGAKKIAVRSYPWKLILGQGKGFELYNLKKDPYESENVFMDEQDVAKEFLEIVKIFRNTYLLKNVLGRIK